MQLNRFKTILHLLFVNNGYWKILALVLAVVIYFTIRSEISQTRVVSVPVEIEKDSDEKRAAPWSIEPPSVKVSIRGSLVGTSDVADSAIQCVIPARQKNTSTLDTVRIKVRSKHIKGIRKFRVVKIEPNHIDVKFDASASRQLNVAPPVIEGTARGTVKLSYDVTNALVTGSQRLLDSLDLESTQIQCEPINVTDRLEPFTARVKLVPPGGSATLRVDPAEILVNVQITSKKEPRVIKGVPVVISYPVGMPNPWIVEPESVDIEISGRSELVGKVDFSDLIASVNGNIPFTPGVTNQVPVIVHVRDGLELDSVKSVPLKINLIPIALPKTPRSALLTTPDPDATDVK